MFPRSMRAKDFLIADSPAMRGVVETIERCAELDAPVLICGEHGTGRELIARVLHQKSKRRDGKFVAVRPTFEGAEIEGQRHDDPDERTRRALRAAEGGTLLVKDVCDVPAPSQRTLRRAIGARREPKRDHAEVHDVRLVGTADLDLESAVAAKILSRDLYEQLGENRIDVPPLRERIADIPHLVEKWLAHYGQEVGRSRMTVSSRAHARLVKYPWPGNVAELKSVARRLVVRVAASRVEAGDIDEVLPVVAERVPLEDMAFEEIVKAKLGGLLRRLDGYPVHDLYEKVLERVERPLFDLVLEHTGGNQLKAAELLGLNRNTLRKKLADHGLDLKRAAAKKKNRGDQALDGA